MIDCDQKTAVDAVEAFWPHVDRESADELVRAERHAFVSIAAIDAVVLRLEGDAVLIEGDQV
jgi:hypothetical protein